MTAVQPPTQEGNRPADASTDTTAGYVTGIADGNLATPVRLREYLSGVGVVFRLPRRDRKKEESDARKVKEAKRFRIRIPVRRIAMAIAPAVMAVGAYYLWDQVLSSTPLPPQVSGTWSTSDGKYAGRNFWINAKAVAFQNGKTTNDFSIHQIKKVKLRQSADTLFLNVDYLQDSKPITLSFAYRDVPQPEVRLVNQPKVRWYKTGAAPAISQ